VAVIFVVARNAVLIEDARRPFPEISKFLEIGILDIEF
jgi:hypothetical protein